MMRTDGKAGTIVTTVRTRNLARALCVGGASLGAIGLIGWLTNLQALITIAPGQPPMMPNTAIGLFLLGIAGALRQSQDPRGLRISLSALAAIIVLLIGVGTLAEYALSLQLNLDQLLVRSEIGPYPGRPSPPTAVALTLLAAAILVFDSKGANQRLRVSDWLSVGAALIAF